MRLQSERIEVADFFAWQEEAYRRGWSDGLPVVPPMPDRVAEMVAGAGREPAEELGELPPLQGVVTIEKLAINAVMAGCRPDYFPVVVAAMEALLDPVFNLAAVQVTTHANEPLLILSGPIVSWLEVNSDHNVFGGGFRANGTIGRAVQLALRNIGGSRPSVPDKATFGQPGKWSFCIGERPDSPWEPLHVRAGLPPEASAVTVFGCEPPQGILVRMGDAGHVLEQICAAIAHPGSSNFGYMGQILVCINAENARLLAASGENKRSIRERVWRDARIPVAAVERAYSLQHLDREGGAEGLYGAGNGVPPTRTPEDIHVVVTGGEGRFCCHCPGWGIYGGHAVTRAVPQPG